MTIAFARMSRSSASTFRSGAQHRSGTGVTSLEDSYEKFFAQRWARFCRENFANATQGAAAFGVRERTFENWLDELNCPSGRKVGLAFVLWPKQAGKHLTGQDTCTSSSGPSSARSSSSATSSRPARTGSPGKRRSGS